LVGDWHAGEGAVIQADIVVPPLEDTEGGGGSSGQTASREEYGGMSDELHGGNFESGSFNLRAGGGLVRGFRVEEVLGL
jgi:hypothetical protein